jgi:hypothetical protein
LIEDVQEDIDASLDSIVQKAVYINDGIKTIRFMDKDVPYDDNF